MIIITVPSQRRMWLAHMSNELEHTALWRLGELSVVESGHFSPNADQHGLDAALAVPLGEDV